MSQYIRKTSNENYITGEATEERIEKITSFLRRNGPSTVNQLHREFLWPIDSIRRICIGLYTRRRLWRTTINPGKYARHYLYELPPKGAPRNPERFWAKHLTKNSFAYGNIMPTSRQKHRDSAVFRSEGSFHGPAPSLPPPFGPR